MGFPILITKKTRSIHKMTPTHARRTLLDPQSAKGGRKIHSWVLMQVAALAGYARSAVSDLPSHVRPSGIFLASPSPACSICERDHM